MTAPVAAPTPRSQQLARRWAGPVSVMAVTAVVGFLVLGQFGGTERFRQRLEAQSEGDLTRILAALTTEADALRDELGALRLRLLRLESSHEQGEAAADTAEEQLRSLQVLAGTVPVFGPGVAVRIEDRDGVVGYDTMIDLVQELRDAGAEAIGVNGRRVGASSWFSERDDRVLLDGTALRAPFTVTAVGQASTLEGGLGIPGGALDTLRSLPGVQVEVERGARVEIAALDRAPTFRVGRPVDPSPPE